MGHSTLKSDKKKNSDKHRRIIEAALKVFAKNGFYNSKVSEIARAANVADGTIYLYFQNKDDILISLFEEEMGNILDKMRQGLQTVTDPAAKLERFAEQHLTMLEENQELAEIIQVELRQSSKFMKEYQNDRFHQYLNIISSIIKEGQAQGVFPQGHPARGGQAGLFRRPGRDEPLLDSVPGEKVFHRRGGPADKLLFHQGHAGRAARGLKTLTKVHTYPKVFQKGGVTK